MCPWSLSLKHSYRMDPLLLVPSRTHPTKQSALSTKDCHKTHLLFPTFSLIGNCKMIIIKLTIHPGICPPLPLIRRMFQVCRCHPGFVQTMINLRALVLIQGQICSPGNIIGRHTGQVPSGQMPEMLQNI